MGITQQIVDSAGIPAVQQAMARHRANCAMQQEGAKTLLAFTITDQYLNALRWNGAIATLVESLTSHNREAASVYESVKTLEKLCPRAMSGFRACCSDAMMALPEVVWSEKLTDDDCKNFRILEGYRRFTFRSELDCHADVIASAAPPSKRIDTPGPSQQELAGLCQLLQVGLDAQWSEIDGSNRDNLLHPVDIEFYCCLIGHYAWHSEALASELLRVDAPTVLLKWLVHPSLGAGSLLNQAAAYPARCACLGALASFSCHGEQYVERLMNLDITEPILECLHHVNADIRRSTLRLLAPLVAYGDDVWTDQRKFLHGLGRGLQDLESSNRIVACSLLVEVLAKKPTCIQGNPEWVPDGMPLHMSMLSSVTIIAHKVGGVALVPGFLALGRLATSEPTARMLALDKFEGQSVLPILIKASKSSSAEGPEATAAAAAWAIGQICQYSAGLANLLVEEQGMHALVENTTQAATADLKNLSAEAIELIVPQIRDCLFLSRLLTHKSKVTSHGFMGLAETDGAGYTYAGPEVLTIISKRILDLLKEDVKKHGSEEAFKLCKKVPIPENDDGASAAMSALRDVMLEIRKLGVHFFVGGTLADASSVGTSKGFKKQPSAKVTAQPGKVQTLVNE